jgi:hypothetical protein
LKMAPGPTLGGTGLYQGMCTHYRALVFHPHYDITTCCSSATTTYTSPFFCLLLLWLEQPSPPFRGDEQKTSGLRARSIFFHWSHKPLSIYYVCPKKAWLQRYNYKLGSNKSEEKKVMNNQLLFIKKIIDHNIEYELYSSYVNLKNYLSSVCVVWKYHWMVTTPHQSC